jgi:hypothetical protein
MAQTRFATVPAHPRPSRYEVVVRHDVLAGVALYQRHERRIALLHAEIEPVMKPPTSAAASRAFDSGRSPMSRRTPTAFLAPSARVHALRHGVAG